MPFDDFIEMAGKSFKAARENLGAKPPRWFLSDLDGYAKLAETLDLTTDDQKCSELYDKAKSGKGSANDERKARNRLVVMSQARRALREQHLRQGDEPGRGFMDSMRYRLESALASEGHINLLKEHLKING